MLIFLHYFCYVEACSTIKPAMASGCTLSGQTGDKTHLRWSLESPDCRMPGVLLIIVSDVVVGKLYIFVQIESSKKAMRGAAGQDEQVNIRSATHTRPDARFHFKYSVARFSPRASSFLCACIVKQRSGDGEIVDSCCEAVTSTLQ